MNLSVTIGGVYACCLLSHLERLMERKQAGFSSGCTYNDQRIIWEQRAEFRFQVDTSVSWEELKCISANRQR